MGAYGILLIAALVVVSGVIAYVGDILGRWMGKRRMTLFNLRPRHTAIVTSIVAGMVIAVLTLASAMAVSENVRDGLTKVGLLRSQNERLRAQQRTLSRKLAATQKNLQGANKALSAGNQRLESLNGDLKAVGKQVKVTRAKLSATRVELAQKRAEVEEANRKGVEVATKWYFLRQSAVRNFETVYTKRVIFRASDPILVTTLDGSQTPYVIGRRLREFVALADQAARKAGAGVGKDGKAIITFTYANVKGELKRFGEAEILKALNDSIAETKGPVIVRALSVGNAVEGEPVLVNFDLFRNRLVFRKGAEIARGRVDSAGSQTRLLLQLITLLRGKVAQEARAKGVMPGVQRRMAAGSDSEAVSLLPDPQESVGTISYDDMLGTIDQIKAAGGVVTVVARAAEDTWTAGPLKVEFTAGS